MKDTEGPSFFPFLNYTVNTFLPFVLTPVISFPQLQNQHLSVLYPPSFLLT